MSYLLPIREPYPSDVTEEQWERIAPLIPAERPRGRRRETDPREIVNAISYRWTVGCAWRMLPHDFPPWTTIYTYFRRWQQDGTLPRLRKELLRPKPRRRASRAKSRDDRSDSMPEWNEWAA
jgi:transposase